MASFDHLRLFERQRPRGEEDVPDLRTIFEPLNRALVLRFGEPGRTEREILARRLASCPFLSV